ncbi:hypothetical protein [Actinomadura rupiterrae]|uniref:hypothetical protein n=1 Tax=Actinomadura rupiterrae TaxID=559627 RepID=UPI0020A2FBD4|nr:hypothetical protein [Actinomadura rupiterrae]MCP2337935.1 hypothetical protein [Actinomadura rupiterrae]
MAAAAASSATDPNIPAPRSHGQRDPDQRAREAGLNRLRGTLVALGVRTRLTRPRSGIWRLRLHRNGWHETVMCAGSEGTYAYVTAHGRLLGPTSDVHSIARLLVWMLDHRQR